MLTEVGYKIVSIETVPEVLVESYQALPIDTHANVAGRFRRYGNFKLCVLKDEGKIRLQRLADRPFFQTKKFSAQYGGRPISFPAFGEMPEIPRIVTDLTRYVPLTPGQDYFIRCHQMRTEISDVGEGRISPEGPHQDGLEYIVMLAVDRKHVVGGVSSVYDLNKAEIFSTQLESGDALIVRDTGQYHAVSDIDLELGFTKGTRDMLLWGYQPWLESYFYQEFGDLTVGPIFEAPLI